jgi:RNA polymerase sigma factor (TIGR02999 family)
VSEVTRILTAIESGDREAADELLVVVYNELRRLAAQLLAREAPGQTLQATALVHEAYLRLVGSSHQSWEGRRHFFAAAAEAMRRILVENARRKRRLKRGGDRKRIGMDLDTADLAVDRVSDDLIALDEALAKLSEKDRVKAELVKLRYFGGLTGEQAAELLGISNTTAKRYWSYARAWLYREIRRGNSRGCG